MLLICSSPPLRPVPIVSIAKDTARAVIKDAGLRVTAPRIAVLRVLSGAERPLSHTDVLIELGESDWDPATIYRNLIKLRDADLIRVVSRVEGIDRYAFASSPKDEHRHPHFVCDDCGRVECLPAAAITLDGPWAASVSNAEVQLRGECPDCLDAL
ncbi:MAG: Fur family ferric uptake transcriptional regulator [Bradymonadia bacterium]